MSSAKNIFQSLPLKKREALGRLYESPEYAVLKEAIDLLRSEAGTWALTLNNWEDVIRLQGQALGLKLLHKNLEELHKTTNEEIDKGKKSKS